MAFDQATRNRLQNFVSTSRMLLTVEFTRQLQKDYGLDPETGEVSDVESLTHLNDAQKETALLLRETLEHYTAGTKVKVVDALDRIIREQAFTVLNRMCALRMAEARGLLLESIAKGFQSKGFQLYAMVAGSGLGETGDAYRSYLYSLFDEFSLDLVVLFDRNSAQGRLFPREKALLELLEQINHFEIDPLWAEDETIGWIYQYFNSIEERKQMRAESQAPRNSRELAVRNQFFTPRYVVEFLTDNTLGRIWYEMTQGNTSLVDSCCYLVRRPNEIFLVEGESVPEEQIEVQEILSQEELLQHPVYIKYRPLKDPREIRMLDPACGSMHFGLYAFDLYEKIYEEAWGLEVELGTEQFERSVELQPLQETYANYEEFRKEIPKLIIENNIHGVDIDSRAVQIAGLSLWQRAQRAWYQIGVKADERPTIVKSNIVCAEPMPGEKDMLQGFTAKLNPPVLGQLVETIFDKMALAGEAGTLLKIEKAIQTTVSEAHEAFNQELLRQKNEKGYLPGMAPKRNTTLLDFAELPDDTNFWDTIEEQILESLNRYAAQTEMGAGQKRLFANDVSKGFAFIDLCRKRFDVLLMNPPFGAPSVNMLGLMADEYPDIKTDLYGAFLIRAIELVVRRGQIGAITSRTGFFVSSFQRWRENHILPKTHLSAMLDLGGGVLDAAMVETAAYVMENFPSAKRKASVFLRLATEDDREAAIAKAMPNGILDQNNSNVFTRDERSFMALPKSPFCYWIPNEVHSIVQHSQAFEPTHGTVYVGVQTDNDERFVRLWSENPPVGLGASLSDSLAGRGWITFLKGDSTSPFYLDHHLTLKWDNNGQELRAATENAPGGRVNNESIYYSPGLSWALRTDYFSPHIVPKGCIPSVSRYEAIPKNKSIEKTVELAAQFSAPIFDFVAKLQMEKWKQPKFIPGVIRNLPVPKLSELDSKCLHSLGMSGIHYSRVLHQTLETCREYHLPWFNHKPAESIQDSIVSYQNKLENIRNELSEVHQSISQIIDKKFGIGGGNKESDWFGFLNSDCEAENVKGHDPVQSLYNRFVLDDRGFTNSVCSWLLGTVFGRWNISYTNTKPQQPESLNPFEPLPICPPGMLKNAKGLPSEPKDIPSNYPLHIIWSGISVVEENTPGELVDCLRKAIAVIWSEKPEEIEQEICEILGVRTLCDYFSKPNAFFAHHLKCYSKSRRQAPIYWPLQTPSCSYTLWVYYHRLNSQTLYTCVNDFVEPKLKMVSEDLNKLRSKLARSRDEERALSKLINLEIELTDYRDELMRLAKFWKPNMNDGVQISAAPLWRLFQHKQWQKKLKKTWEKMEEGEYDWAHLCLNIWPERVLKKCCKDRSFAIAHGVENDLWESLEVPIVRKGKDTGQTKIEWQPKQFTSKELDDYIARKVASMK